MSRLDIMKSYVPLHIQGSMSACHSEGEGYFCNKTEALHKAISCRACPADSVKKWEAIITCLDSTP